MSRSTDLSSDLSTEGASSADSDASATDSQASASYSGAEESSILAEGSAEESAQDGAAGPPDGVEDELSLAEASELVGVSTRALRDRVQRGSLPARKVTREGRVLSVVRRSDLMDIYGWMVKEGERKRQAEDAGVARRPESKLVDSSGLEDPLGDATQKLRQEVDKLQNALVDVTAEMRLVREAQARQREQDIRARADHEREVKALQDRASALADELRGTKRPNTKLGRTPWEMVSVVLLLTVVVVGLWARSQMAQAELYERFEEIENLKVELVEFMQQPQNR